MASLSVLKSRKITHKLGEGCENCGKHIATGKTAYYVIDRETWNDSGKQIEEIVSNGWFESVHCSSTCANETCSTF